MEMELKFYVAKKENEKDITERTMAEIARKLGVTRQAINFAVANGGKVKGWEISSFVKRVELV